MNVVTFDPRTGQPLWVEIKLGTIGTSESKGLMFAHTAHVCPACVEDLSRLLPDARDFLGSFVTREATIALPPSPPVPADMSVTTSTGTLEAPFKIVRFEVDDEDAWVINDVRIKDGHSMASIFNESKALSVAEVNADVSAFTAAQIGQNISIIMTPKDLEDSTRRYHDGVAAALRRRRGDSGDLAVPARRADNVNVSPSYAARA